MVSSTEIKNPLQVTPISIPISVNPFSNLFRDKNKKYIPGNAGWDMLAKSLGK